MCYECIEPHTCWTCHDAGRVRVATARADERFGKAIPCPDCVGTTSEGGWQVGEDEFLRRARIPVKYRECQISSWQPFGGEPAELCSQYIAVWPPERPWLLLYGAKGTGKTHLACGVLRALWALHGRIGMFYPMRDLLDRVKATFDDERATESEADVQRMLTATALLVLDDYEQRTEWEERWLYTLINGRYNGQLPTVVTTNRPLGDDRIVDRIIDVRSTVLVKFEGESRRRTG